MSMPKVGKKSFPYTPAGMRAAKTAQKRMPKKRKTVAAPSDMGMQDPAAMQADTMRRRFGM